MTARDEAIERAAKALARRDHSSASLMAKLERAGVSEEVSKAAVGALERGGYVDDVRLAHARAAHLAAKGDGDEWIRGDLETQGAPADAIAALDPETARAE